jgi:hypothetical protein
MFRLGGTAILPIQVAANPSDDLLPNRHLSLWPYSHIHDPRLRIEDEFVLVTAQRAMPPFKIGVFNPTGWTVYWLDGILFRKMSAVSAELRHPDFDCNAEIYCGEHFIEIESLAPLTRLAPGESVTFLETWDLYDSLKHDFLSERMIELLGTETAE